MKSLAKVTESTSELGFPEALVIIAGIVAFCFCARLFYQWLSDN